VLSAGRPVPSPLAIASLAAGLLVCCPIVPQIVAVTLGFMALSRIRAAAAAGGPAIGGRRLAIAGIALGGIGLVLQAIAAERIGLAVREVFDRDLRAGVTAVLAASDEPSARAALGSISSASSLTAAEVLAFATAARDRFGEPDGLSIISQIPTGNAFRQEVSSAVVFGFRRDGRRAERTGSVSAEVVTPFGRVLPTLRILEISIEGGTDGAADLRLGPPAPAGTDSGENVPAASPPLPAP
jgi:hypothetical protein